jgi:hypothetical protein
VGRLKTEPLRLSLSSTVPPPQFIPIVFFSSV